MVFRANKKNCHWRFISSESLAELNAGLDELDRQGYQWESVTLDGRRGMIQLFAARYPGIPIQLCQFHQAQIIRRYTTNNPKTECGRALKELMYHLTRTDEEVFTLLLETLHEIYPSYFKMRDTLYACKVLPCRF